MWHWLGKVKEMGFSGVNNFPTHTIVDGHFRGVLEETGMSVQKEFEMVALARRMDLFSVVYVATPEEAVEMAKAGADAIIAHVGTTVGGSIGVKKAVVTWDFTIKRTQEIIDAASRVRKDIFFLCHGGPINTPDDADRVIQEHGRRRFRRREFAGTHGRGRIADEPHARVQETETPSANSSRGKKKQRRLIEEDN